ncbi:hypothetical protein [Consotaella aegiceratis]|uniref:hypothetical protein n=1 Tax=Consotaella aegiceratis TaxID=3097961 RepID=UPI002F4162F6
MSALATIEDLPLPADPDDRSAAVTEAAAVLTDIAGRIDTTFVATGDRLMQCVMLLSQILTAFQTLEETYTSPELAAAADAVLAIGEDGRRFLEGFIEERNLVQGVQDVIIQARGPMLELRRTINMMGAIAINARMVAAAMRHGNEDLAVFTSDVMDLSRKAGATIELMQERYDRLLPELDCVNTRGAQFEKHYKTSIGGLSDRVAGHIAALDRHRLRNLELGADVRKMAAGFSGRVSDVVAALQIGDSTRQRVEHVVAALEAVASIERGDETAGDDPLPTAPDERDWLARLITTIQDDQLSATHRHFDAEANGARTTLTTLANDLDRAFRDAMSKLRGSGQGGGDPLKGIEAEMALTVRNLRTSASECQAIDEVVEAVEDTVRDLLESAQIMRSVEHEMRLVSLNTAIACSKLGIDGRALSVISLQLRELTGDMVALSDQVCNPLTKAGELAGELVETGCDCGSEQVVGLEKRGQESLALLAGVDAKMAETSALLDDAGPQITRLARDAVGVFDEQDRIADDLAASSDDLAALSSQANANSAPALAEMPEAARPVLDRLRRRCTMAEERTIQDRFAGAPATETVNPEAPASIPAATDAEDLDDVLF